MKNTKEEIRTKCLEMSIKINEPYSSYSANMVIGGYDKPVINEQAVLNTAAKLYKFISTGKTK